MSVRTRQLYEYVDRSTHYSSDSVPYTSTHNWTTHYSPQRSAKCQPVSLSSCLTSALTHVSRFTHPVSLDSQRNSLSSARTGFCYYTSYVTFSRLLLYCPLALLSQCEQAPYGDGTELQCNYLSGASHCPSHRITIAWAAAGDCTLRCSSHGHLPATSVMVRVLCLPLDDLGILIQRSMQCPQVRKGLGNESGRDAVENAA